MLLRQLLYRSESRFLSIISGFWFRLNTTPNYEDLIRMLCDRMLDPAMMQKMLDSEEGQQFRPAISYLLQKGGQESTEQFEELFGPVRIAGIDKITREKYWQNPVSISEKLWYRGLIFRENRFINNEPKDCYILPEDIKTLLGSLLPESADYTKPVPHITVRPAIPSETISAASLQTNLPDMISLAAALKRDNRPLEFPGMDVSPEYIHFLDDLLIEGNLKVDAEQENTEVLRDFLTENRVSARIQLAQIWRKSETYDELSGCDAVAVVSPPEYTKSIPRETILQYLCVLPPDTWWSVNGFVSAVKKDSPNFLRKSYNGDRGQLYDKDGNDLSGIGSWYQLEGEYIRFLLFGPLQWLGIVQAAYENKGQKEPTAFRLNKEALFLIQESAEDHLSETIRSKPNLEQAAPVISADGAITCSNQVPRYFRYMTTRFCEIEKVRTDSVVFRITPGSLSNAESNGLDRGTFLKLLQRFTKNKVPPTLENMLAPKENPPLPATIYSATILTIPNNAVLTELLETSRLEKWVLQQINASSLLIDPKGISEIRRFLMEREIFVDIQV